MLAFTIGPVLPAEAATVPATATLPTGVTALYGANEYTTASAIATAAYPHGTKTVIITSGATADWVDALVAAPLAKALGAPILLSTSAHTIGSAALQALDRLGATHVVLVGATAADATQWTAQLPPGTVITAIGSANPYQTAGAVAQVLAQQEHTTTFAHVFVTSGVPAHLVDALAADPVAARLGDPILLVPASGDSGQVNAAELPWLNHATDATIVGAAQAYAYADLPATVTRTTIYGQDRAGTATALDQAFAPTTGYTSVFVANGVDAHLVDALSAGPLVAADDAALIEVYNGTVPPSTAHWLKGASTVHALTVLGGPASIPAALYDQTTSPVLQALVGLGVHPTLTVSQASVAQGTRVTLQVQGVPATQTVEWAITSANADTGVLQGDGPTAAFVGTSAGAYTIQATVAGETLSHVITTYGNDAAQFAVTAPSTSVVADGQATVPVTIQAEDAAGTPIPDWNGTVTIATSPDATYTQNGAALPSGSTANTGLVTLTNGSATIDVGSVSVPGLTLTIQPSDATALSGSSTVTTPTYGTLSVTSVLPQATALQFVNPPQYLASNIAGTSTPPFAVEVVDQAGHPLLSGVTPITVTVQGPGTVGTTGQTTGTVTYNGSLAPAGTTNRSAPVSITDIQGATGTITVTATADGLTPATTTLQAVIAGVATQVVPTLSTPTLVTNAALTTPATVTLQAEDASGVPVSDNSPVTVTVTPQGSTTPSTTVTLTPTQGTTAGSAARGSAIKAGSWAASH
jgi:putative cell wall-binding protein